MKQKKITIILILFLFKFTSSQQLSNINSEDPIEIFADESQYLSILSNTESTEVASIKN